ncbi:MAG: enoyl-CoA hydratase/isomerase family protein [Symbiobacteriaceae bacterium]|jgi:enoyl-CoA hydratase/carnithine racemase|nr:enoyl-CoA hydratase/isomerase family protein [Symbiobacteriaceae bacterium]
MTAKRVHVRREGFVAEVALHNPERYNALSRQVVEELKEAAALLATAADVRAVIVHGGESKAFCSGADLKERQGMGDAQVYEMVHLLRETVTLYERLPMPVIAAVHGMAFGGGCELALACDIRLMSEDAQIGLTEVSWAIIPGAGGCIRLPQLVGPAVAKELIFTARKLTAAEALGIGLVNRVVAREELLPAAREMAVRIAAQGPLAVRAAKRAINGGLALGTGLALEWEAYQSILPTEDRQEGLRAFAEKRPPEYRGR